MNVLTAFLASHGIEMNSHYTALVASKARSREKLKHKVECISELRSEISTLEEKYDKLADAEFAAARSSDELAQTDAKLSDQTLVIRDLQNELAFERSKSQEYKDAAADAEDHLNSLRGEVTNFVGSEFESLIHKLLSSDEFNFALARIAYLGITSGVERDLRMVEFNKAVTDLPSIKFPFLAKIAEASEGALSKISNIQPDKLPRPTAPASVTTANSVVARTFGWTSAPKGSELPGLGTDVSSPSFV
ncbi:hypothetical protein Tco_0493871 [Tanacetum coccineum]